MSVVNHNYKYIFCHEPGTAGRAIEAALMIHKGSQNFNGDHHICAIDMIDNQWVTEEQFDKYFKFRIIRNPYDWLVTCWLRNTKNQLFTDWVFTKGLGFTSKGTLFWRYQDETDASIRFENLEESLNDLFKSFSIPPIRLGLIGVTKDKPDWRTLLTVAQAKQLEAFYPDINGFGYNIFNSKVAKIPVSATSLSK